jgi:hypothetical protein
MPWPDPAAPPLPPMPPPGLRLEVESADATRGPSSLVPLAESPHSASVVPRHAAATRRARQPHHRRGGEARAAGRHNGTRDRRGHAGPRCCSPSASQCDAPTCSKPVDGRPPQLQAAADALVAAPPRGLQVLVDRDRLELVSLLGLMPGVGHRAYLFWRRSSADHRLRR